MPDRCGELWPGHAFATAEDAETALAEWEHHYNYERFSLPLGGLTPAEKLQLKLKTAGPSALLGSVIHPPPIDSDLATGEAGGHW